MPKHLSRKASQVVSDCVARWRTDVRELTTGMLRDPLVQGRGRSWERDFPGEIDGYDVRYAIFLGVLSLIPAAVVAYTTSAFDLAAMVRFLRAPLQYVITGFLASILLFAGSHFNRSPRPFPVAFKLMLRVVAIHPLLGFLGFFAYGEVLILLLFGFFMIRGVRKTYLMPVHSAVAFYGTIYTIFALMQLQSIVSPMPAREPFKYHSESSVLPPSKAIVRTSSSRSKPN